MILSTKLRTLLLTATFSLTSLPISSCTLLQQKPRMTTENLDENTDGIEELVVTEYDEMGREVKLYRDYNRDNIWDEVSWGSYNAEGIMNTVKVDYNNDGLADEVSEEEYQGEVLRKREYWRYDEKTRKVLVKMIDYFDEQGKLATSETILPNEREKFIYHPRLGNEPAWQFHQKLGK